MHIQIGDHALIDKLQLREVAGKFDALRLTHLAWNDELDPTRKLRVLAYLERLHIVPEPFAVGPLLRCAIRQQHHGTDDAALGGKVLHAVEALVAQPRSRAVGGGRYRAASSLAAGLGPNGQQICTTGRRPIRIGRDRWRAPAVMLYNLGEGRHSIGPVNSCIGGLPMTASYDEGRISLITAEVAEAIEQASLGRVPWTLPAEIFSTAFPGGFAALINQDFVHDSINFMEWVNLDEHAAATYVEHFAYINPWAEVWTRMRSGSVFVAERYRPARTFANTEFYNDWLAPQGDVVGGVGLKVDASPTDVVYFPMHYPGRYAETYDGPAAEVSRRLVAPIQRAIEIAASIRSGSDRAASQAAVIGRAWPSVVVDASLKLCGANSEAEALIARENTLICRNGRIAFRNATLHRLIADAVLALARSPASAESTISWVGQHEPTIYSLSRVPVPEAFPRSLVSAGRQVLVVMKRLARPPLMEDLTAFRQLYGLTKAEARLCLSLYAGRTLQEAAAELGLAYETIRTCTKAVFAKTGTRSQSALCALLARYAA